MNERPHPPGDHPVVIVGSGPGALQVSETFRRLGIAHAVISADEEPGGTFLRWPHFQRLITWTKPHSSVQRRSRRYERYDWNSLVSEDDGRRALVADNMDGTSYFPSREEMRRGVVAFAERAAINVRHGCRWTATRVEGGRYVLETSDGEYRTPTLVVATGMTRPYRPPIPGLEGVPHYAEVKPLAAYRDRRVLIIGKRNSGFELADGLLAHARQIVLASPRPALFALETHTTAGVRARYVQPFEDHILRGGTFVLDASVERIERDGSYRAHLRPSSGGDELVLEFDEVIAATGFMSDLVDLPRRGLATHGHLEVPAQSPFWESPSLPGVFFAGTLTQGARGLRKHGVPSASASVHGFRYNARILASRIAATRMGVRVPRRTMARDEAVSYVLDELTHAPELWLQRGYLARVVRTDADAFVDDGIVPLQTFVDDGGDDALALTIELDAAGMSYPVIYLRRRGEITEHPLEPAPLLSFETPTHRREIEALLADSHPVLKPV